MAITKGIKSMVVGAKEIRGEYSIHRKEPGITRDIAVSLSHVLIA